MRLLVILLCLAGLAGCSALAGTALDLFARAASNAPGPIPPGPADLWQAGLALVGKASIVIIWLGATIVILTRAFWPLPHAAKASVPQAVNAVRAKAREKLP